MILFDTNVLIHYLKGLEPVTSRVKASPPNEVAIPSIVAYELEYGTLKSSNPGRRAALERVLSNLEEIPFDSAAARSAAEIRVGLERVGETIGPLDLLIAGTAISRGAALATNNISEFDRIKSLRLYDWSRP